MQQELRDILDTPPDDDDTGSQIEMSDEGESVELFSEMAMSGRKSKLRQRNAFDEIADRVSNGAKTIKASVINIIDNASGNKRSQSDTYDDLGGADEKDREITKLRKKLNHYKEMEANRNKTFDEQLENQLQDRLNLQRRRNCCFQTCLCAFCWISCLIFVLFLVGNFIVWYYNSITHVTIECEGIGCTTVCNGNTLCYPNKWF